MNELLSRARRHAERASTPVRIAAQLRIARVESAADRSAARITMEMAIADIPTLPPKDRDAFLDLARRTAAAIAPELISQIPASNQHHRFHGQFSAGELVRIMLSHGHTDQALDFVANYDDPSSFPFVYIGNVLTHVSCPERRLQLIRAAIKAWRAQPARDFLWTFKGQWQELPPDEARLVLREIVQAALDEPNSPMTATYDEGRLQFTSFREHTLFEVLHILRRLEPALAEELIATNKELAAGAARYPNGWDTIREEDERERARRLAEGATCGGFIMSGNPEDRSYMMALYRASQDGDFAEAFGEALQNYAEDAHPEHPNHAPKEFWPSTVRFRQVLVAAGRRNGESAKANLAAIPDNDVRVLASIELAAALAGLPELPGLQWQSHPGWYRDRSHGTTSEWKRRWPLERYSSVGNLVFGVRVRCPHCNWLPTEDDQWSCRCHHRWNTFATRGKCPSCEYQWEITSCFSCGHASAHQDWYLPEEPHE